MIPDNELIEMEARCAAVEAAEQALATCAPEVFTKLHEARADAEAALLAAARTDIPLLLTHIREQGAELEAIDRTLDDGKVWKLNDGCPISRTERVAIAIRQRDHMREQREAALRRAETAEREVGELRAKLTAMVETAKAVIDDASDHQGFALIRWPLMDDLGEAQELASTSLTPTGAPNAE
jgi:hypothetical protein